MRKNRFLARKITAVLLICVISAPALVIARTDPGPRTKNLTEEQKILHVLSRLGFGPRPGDVEKVKATGLAKYIERQLSPDLIDDSAAEKKVGHLEAFEMTTTELFAKYPNPAALLSRLEAGRNSNGTSRSSGEKSEADERRERQQKLRALYREYDLRPANQILPQIVANRLLRAVYSERQLQEVMVDFWQNHFNVFAGKAAVRWYIPSYERDVIRRHALGNFKDLVIGTAQHPAMLFYLDNFESASPNAQTAAGRRPALQRALRDGKLTPEMRRRIRERFGLTDRQIDERVRQFREGQQNQQQRRRGINENYARELMELHTLGVDGGYTQQDIVEVARAFTGWTIVDPRGYRRAAADAISGTGDRRLNRLQRRLGLPDDAESGEFFFNERWHDPGTKIVLGQKINEGGIRDGLKVIDILVSHPSTAKFLARKLAVKFVSDNPSEALVGRIAKEFRDSKGDIRRTLRAIFADPEFFAAENYRAKIKTPFELAVSAIRAVGADTDSNPAMVGLLQKMGEVPYGYQAPTGYPDKAENWVNTGALLERLNFAVALASGRIPGTRVDLKRFEAPEKGAILEKTIAVVLAGEISSGTRSTLLRQIEQPLPEPKISGDSNMQSAEDQPPGQNRRLRLLRPSGNPEVFKIVSLVLGTPEFQRQ